MTKYTEQEVREFADSVADDGDLRMSGMLTAYADLMAAQQADVIDGWKHPCNALLINGLELWTESCPHCGKPAPDHFRGVKKMITPSPAAEGAKVDEGWIRAIDEALVVHHVGVADAADSYETAKDKLNRLLCCAQDIGALHAQPAEVPVQPSVIDERALFEEKLRCHIDPATADDLIALNESGNYDLWAIMLAWELWKDRAALAQQAPQKEIDRLGAIIELHMADSTWLLQMLGAADTGYKDDHYKYRNYRKNHLIDREKVRAALGRQQGRDADRWKHMESASSLFWLTIYNTRPDLRAGKIDAAIAAARGE